MRLRDLLEQAPTRGPRPRKIIMAEGTVGNHGYAVLFAPGDHAMLDGALLQMVENLVAREMAITGNSPDGFEFTDVEVADAPGQDLSITLELLEGSDRVLQRILTRPVQKVTIQPIGL